MAQPNPKAIASASSSPVAAGAFINPVNSNVLSNGTLVMKLHLPIRFVCSLTGGGEVTNNTFNINLDSNGVPAVGQVMYGSDQYSNPVNPGYDIDVYDSSGNFVGTISNVAISGSAPLDLTLNLATQTGTVNPTAIVTNPTGQQTINAFPLVLEGTILGFSPSSSTTADTGISRSSAGVVAIGNGNQGDASGTINAATYQVGGVSPTGSGPLVRQTGATITNPAINGATLDKITQKAATAFTIISNAGGTYYSLPSNGTSQATINNSKLTGTAGSNSVTLLSFQGPIAAITGTGADVTLYTFSIPANTINSGKGIKATVGWQHTTGTASVTYKFKFGATTVATNTDAGTVATVLNFGVNNLAGSTTSQFAWQESTNAGAAIYSSQFATPAENTVTNAISATFTFSVAATDQVTGKFMRLELIQ